MHAHPPDPLGAGQQQGTGISIFYSKLDLNFRKINNFEVNRSSEFSGFLHDCQAWFLWILFYPDPPVIGPMPAYQLDMGFPAKPKNWPFQEQKSHVWTLQKIARPSKRCAFRPLQGLATMSNRSDICLHLCRILWEQENLREQGFVFLIPKET